MSEIPTLAVWYILINKDGTPYKGTTVDKVRVSSNADVADFRDLVKLKNADDLLMGISPGKLLVYQQTKEPDFGNGILRYNYVEPWLNGGIQIVVLGVTENNPLIVVVPQPSSNIPTNVSKCWLVTGSVSGALVTKGVRCRLYRLADSFLGYYEGDKSAFVYSGKTLLIHVVFRTEERALQFDSQIRNEEITVNSPLNGLQVEISVSEITRSELGKRIYFKDYQPLESDSPQETMSQITEEYSMYGPTTDLFKYQRIENRSVFTSKGKAESAHLISRAHCNAYESYRKFDNDENNRLALSRDFHGWFDELNSDIPLVNLEFKNASETPMLDNRYEVTIHVKALDQESASTFFWRLNEGSKKTEDDLIMETSVYVLNPTIFKKCLDWKSNQINKRWEDYFSMDSAVP